MDVSPEQLEAWVQFRRVYGLVHDVGWILAVANNPAATSANYDVPLLPFEQEQVQAANTTGHDLLPVARAFADDAPEFAGAWLELPRVVLAFNDRVPEHEADARALFFDKVIVRGATFSLSELEAFMAPVAADEAWFESAGARVMDIGIDEALNIVRIHVQTPVEGLEAAARERFGDTGWMRFSYAGPGPWTGPVGDLEITVIDKRGNPAPARCLAASPDPRVQAEKVLVDMAGKCLFRELAAVEWRARIDSEDGSTEPVFEAYMIPAGGVVQATVVIGN